MIILGGIAFSVLAVLVLAIFLNEYGKEATRKSEAREALRKEVEAAISKKDITSLKRIRLMNASELDHVDNGLSKRLDAYIDDLYINDNDKPKLGKAL